MKTITELRAEMKRTIKMSNLEVTHKGYNNFEVYSPTSGNTYQVEVFFKGRVAADAPEAIYGYSFNFFCNCAAGERGAKCVHADKVFAVIKKDWTYIYAIFGVRTGDNHALWAVAANQHELLQKNAPAAKQAA